MAKLNGNSLIFEIYEGHGGTGTLLGILETTNHNISLSNAVIETTTKTNASTAEYLPGRFSYTGSATGNVDLTSTVAGMINTQSLFDLASGNATTTANNYRLTWTLQDATQADGTGKLTYTGQGIITGFTLDGPTDDVATWSLDFQGTSGITKAVAS